MARILLSVPSFDYSVDSRVDEALGNLDRCGHEIVQRNIGGWDVARARNLMAHAALDENCDYLFMVDSDTVPPRDALTHLMSHNLDVCLGWYPRGTDPSMTNMIVPCTLGYTESFPVSELERLADNGVELLEVKAGGLGCALIKTSVFRRFKAPWFLFVNHGDGRWLGEDNYFCQQVAQSGSRIYADARVRCGHVKDTVL